MVGLVSFAPFALAVKRAPFPNSTSLQPIPRNVQPNISGNVNSDVTSDQTVSGEVSSDTAAEQTVAGSQEAPAGGRWYLYIGAVIGIVAILFLRAKWKQTQ